MANLSKTVRQNLLYILNDSPTPLGRQELRDRYVALEGCDSEFDFGTLNNGWSKLRGSIHNILVMGKKKGIFTSPEPKKYSVAQGQAIPSSFVVFLTDNPQPVVETKVATPVEPVVEVAPVVEETPVVEVEPVIEVSVSNPAVIEAHIDTETQELVENVGGSQDYRKPLDQVEDGYITSNVPSSVQVSTTTLDPVVEETEPVEVEFVEAPVEPVEVQEVVEPTPVAETPVEDNLDSFFDDVDVEIESAPSQPQYDVKALRKSASFDPLVFTVNGVTTKYEVYRDTELRNIVLTQPDRDDAIAIPVDVDMNSFSDGRYAKYAEQARNLFDNAGNHKQGSEMVVKALAACTQKCQHTDDFGGFLEDCLNPKCPLKTIWGGVATYVNPQNA